jgi:vacuolar iron transporter family protein
MMDFELKLEKPETSDAWYSALAMGLSYFLGMFTTFGSRCQPRRLKLYPGGLIPMIPYFAMKRVTHALFVSIGISVVVLLTFGFIKSRVVVKDNFAAFKSAVQTLVVGVIAAGASYGIVRGVNSSKTL